MQVEITKMVYQHPWYVPQLSTTQMAGWGGLFISHVEKVAVGVENLAFYY